MINSYLKTVRIVTSIAMIATSIITVTMFFQVIENPNPQNNDQLLLVFNDVLWSHVDVSSLYIGIITTASAIIAIGFSINHITMTKIFESYNSRKFDTFFKKQKLLDAFIVLIIIVMSSSILLVITNALDATISYALATFSLIFFIYALKMFFEAFFGNFKLINKFTMLDTLEDEIIGKIKNETN